MIVGVVYNLAINNYDRIKKKEEIFTLSALKTYLNDMNATSSAKILCLDDCSECDIYVDDNKTDIRLEDFLDDSVKTYRYEFSYGFIEKEKDVYFNLDGIEEDICFSYEITKDGVGDQVIVEFKNKVYDYSGYLTPTVVFDSLEEFTQNKEIFLREILR